MKFDHFTKEQTATPHLMEAGGVDDLMRFSITVEDVEGMLQLFEEIKALRMSEDNLELVAVRNDFHKKKGWDNYKDVRLYILVGLPNDTMLMVEAKLTLADHIVLKKAWCILNGYETGKYTEANRRLRMCAEDKTKVAQPLGAVKQRFAVCSSLDGEPKVYRWITDTDAKSSGMLEPPDFADTAKNGALTQWKELAGDGTIIEDKDFKLGHVVSDKVMPVEHLKELIANEEYVEMSDKEIQRLHLELSAAEVRLFRDPSQQLTKVHDYVILHALSVEGDGYLVHETPGHHDCPLVRRKANEPLASAASYALRSELPDFLKEAFDIKPFTSESIVYITYDDDEAEVEDSCKATALSSAKRYFIMKAALNENTSQFPLLRAAIGVDNKLGFVK